MNSPSKLASLGDEFWSLGLDELESLQEVLAKIIEAKQAMEGVSEKNRNNAPAPDRTFSSVRR